MGKFVYLVRHGETDWNRIGRMQGHSDIPLNETGREQARALATKLAKYKIGRVGSSDLLRARETAEIVARAIGVSLVDADRGLRERSFGSMEGLTRDECSARLGDVWTRYVADPKNAPPGAEPYESVIERIRASVVRSLAHLVQEDYAMLLVTHGGVMRAFATSVNGTPAKPVPNGSIFRVEIDGAHVKSVHAFDDENSSPSPGR